MIQLSQTAAKRGNRNGGESVDERRIYIAIDLKSFYASVECVRRGLNPMTTNLIVADKSRTEKTICLAVSPALKQHGIPGRPRLFEVIAQVKAINASRRKNAPGGAFSGSSYDAPTLQTHPELSLDYLIAQPQMAHYMEASAEIYRIYLKYAAPEDIHVYSIDEVFIDATAYLKNRGVSARDFTAEIINDVFTTTGITATAGIGTNMYLCKVAMDIVAKHMPPDRNGARIAELDEMSYRRQLWNHRPLTDFWRVGRAYARKLEENGMFTMGDVARCSLERDYVLYELFGINAELLIDHAWGWEPCRIADVKAFKPQTNSLGSGQVLQQPYTAEKAKLVLREMTDQLVLELVDAGLVTDQLVVTVGYDAQNVKSPGEEKYFHGETKTDHYGRKIPKHAHGTANLGHYSSSTEEIVRAASELFDRIVSQKLLIRRLNITANHVIDALSVPDEFEPEQLDMFTDYEARDKRIAEEKASREKEKRRQEAMISIKKKYGKNAILKGFNFEEGATGRERNSQIGGHRA